MKSRFLASLCVGLMAACLFLGCQKVENNIDNPDPGPENPPGPPPVEMVNASVRGRVLDDQSIPVQGATISIGTVTTTTNRNGEFTFLNVSLVKNAAFIKVDKSGFFTGGRTFMATEGGKHFVSVQLIKKNAAGTFSGSAGGQVSISVNKGQISFPANSVVTAAGNAAYTGTVTVNAHFIDPVLANYGEELPGALRGINASPNEQALLPGGILAVELVGSGGEQLKLANGIVATVTTPAYAHGNTPSPNSVPVWSFNDTTGLWKQEGTATKQGSNYVFEVSHFSYWSSTGSSNAVTCKALLKSDPDIPLDRVKIVLLSSTGNEYIYTQAYTDSTGHLVFKVPSNGGQIMYAIAPCGRKVGIREVSIVEEYDFGLINIGSFPLTNPFTISGTVMDCNAAPVANGYVTINLDGRNYRTDVVAGTFSTVIDRCNNLGVLAELSAYDQSSGQTSLKKQVQVSSATVNAGELVACTQGSGEFLTYTLGGRESHYSRPADTLYAQEEVFYIYEGDYYDTVLYVTCRQGIRPDQNFLYMQFRGRPGKERLLDLSIYNANYVDMGTSFTLDPTQGPYPVNMTEYGPVGGYIAGNFTAKLSGVLGPPTINVSFRVKRRE